MAESSKKHKKSKAAKQQRRATQSEQTVVQNNSTTQENSVVEAEIVQSTASSSANAPIDTFGITHRTSSQPTGSTLGSKAKIYSGQALRTIAKPKVRWTIAGVVVAVVLLLVMWWQWQRSFVAVINGQYIPTSQLINYALVNNGSQALPSLTQQFLIDQEAHQQGIVIPEDVIKSELQVIIDESGGQDSYEDALAQYGIPEEHLIRQIRTKQILVELTKDKINITDDQLLQYYNDNQDRINPQGDRSFESVKDLIRVEMTEQRQEAEFSTAIQTMQEKSTVSTHLGNATLTFKQFLNQQIFSIPGDIAHLFNTLTGRN